MSGQYSSRLGCGDGTEARVTGRPRALDIVSENRVLSVVMLRPSGRVTRTGGVGAPSSGGEMKAARKSNIPGHFLGFLALTTLPEATSTSARQRSPRSPASVTSHLLSSSPIIDFTGYRIRETIVPSGMLPPLGEGSV